MHDKTERSKADHTMHDEPIIILNDVTFIRIGVSRAAETRRG